MVRERTMLIMWHNHEDCHRSRVMFDDQFYFNITVYIVLIIFLIQSHDIKCELLTMD